MNEFNLIKKYFLNHNDYCGLSVPNGDDCAVLGITDGHEVAISMDTLVNGVHFDHSFSAEDIGYKALAVNLSDLAAMGATPAWVMLSLTMPEINETWITGFANGFFSHFKQYPMALVGGDITKGPLSITIQISGLLPKSSAICRSGAQVGDAIYITNTVGDAVLALHYLQKKIQLSDSDAKAVLPKLYQPTPQIKAGELLRRKATSAIDLSDGLYGDLNHILSTSHVGADIYIDQIPISDVLAKQPLATRRAIAMNCGDSYELCFTMPTESQLPEGVKATYIGNITKTLGLRTYDNHQNPISVNNDSYQHF